MPVAVGLALREPASADVKLLPVGQLDHVGLFLSCSTILATHITAQGFHVLNKNTC